MGKFKNRLSSDSLEGYEKKFCDAIIKVAAIVCENTTTTIENTEIIRTDDDVLVVTVTINPSGNISREFLLNMSESLLSYFPAFFTPTHYRPYNAATAIRSNLLDEGVDIMGVYAGGI